MLRKNKTTSFFEFWPAWVMYFPVGLQWLVLSVYYRSLTLPFLANPNLELAGMVGVGKSALFKQASGKATKAVLPWVIFSTHDRAISKQAKKIIEDAKNKNITLPFVCKPDIGCRGRGVKLIETQKQLEDVIKSYPAGTTLMLQKLASYNNEVGIFYVKKPRQKSGNIVSMTEKLCPVMIGDGERTLSELINDDPRARALTHLYQTRHENGWARVPKQGEKVRLVFAGTHSQGAVFLDANKHITKKLTKAVDEIMHGFDDFHYGRLDVKFKDIDSLKDGKHLQIVEINGASAEAIHIWDKDAKFFDAIKTLMWQYRTLFQIGAYHREQGRKPPSLKCFIEGFKRERGLKDYYPYTD